MNSFKKMAIGFGLVSIITLQGLQANELKECEGSADKEGACVEIEYFKNGEIKSETPYKNGKLDGIVKEYYENGKLESEVPYKDNQENGVYRTYYANGKIKEDGEYVTINSMKQWIGDRKLYTEDGKLLGTMTYKKPYYRLQFVKCGERKLSSEEADAIMSGLNTTEGWSNPHGIFSKYCK